jgi:hypothetical protein
MDKLEEFILKNREDLDRYTPPASIGRKIQKKLLKGKSPFKKWLSVAAMFVVILGSTFLLFRINYSRSDSGNEIISESNSGPSNPQLKETEIYYNNRVNSLYREAIPLLTANPEIKKELNTDISHLDSICSEIKKDLKDNVANQEVVEALIQNYRIKIRLLEDMLTILKEDETKGVKTKGNEL